MMDEAKSQSYAKTPRLDHISQLEVFAHWIPEALQADAESVVKSFRTKMGSRVGALKRAASARQQDANEKSNSGDGDAHIRGAPLRLEFRQQSCTSRRSLASVSRPLAGFRMTEQLERNGRQMHQRCCVICDPFFTSRNCEPCPV